MVTQNYSDSLLLDNWVANREDINYSACLTTSISELTFSERRINVVPNPFSTQTVLQTDNPFNNATLTIFNCYVQVVKQIKNISGQAFSLYRDNLTNGMYFIQLTQDNSQIITRKLIITD
jgi:hypothetical protein